MIVIPKQVPGALTAVKFFKRLEEGASGKIGIVISDCEGHEHVIVQFPNIRKVINARYLETVDEIRHKSSKLDK